LKACTDGVTEALSEEDYETVNFDDSNIILQKIFTNVINK
jgi:ABC-type uncharacterized transport system substrate-binding protein